MEEWQAEGEVQFDAVICSRYPKLGKLFPLEYGGLT